MLKINSIFFKLGGVIFLVVIWVFIAYIHKPAVIITPTQSSNPTPSSNTLRVVGNKVYTIDNKVFVPYGISVYGGLESPNYQEYTANDDAQIEAAAKYWNANTIRLQVAETNLFKDLGRGQQYNPDFLRALTKQINLAHTYGMAVVINDQTEFTSQTLSPTQETSDFWRIVSKKFENEPYVIFDLFNEPRVNVTNNDTIDKRLSAEEQFDLFGYSDNKRGDHSADYQRMLNDTDWSVWRNGGSVDNVNYIGMQALVNQIRSYGVNNLIWVEGADGARQLPPKQYLLTGSNVVYSIHHPALNNPKSWNKIAELAAIRPVVEGEWAQYESNWAECYPDAYVTAPMYINFLHQHNIGIIAWSLQAGSLLKGDSRIRPTNTNTSGDPVLASELSSPNKLGPNYTCEYQSGEGVGQLLKTDFAQNSIQYNL